MGDGGVEKGPGVGGVGGGHVAEDGERRVAGGGRGVVGEGIAGCDVQMVASPPAVATVAAGGAIPQETVVEGLRRMMLPLRPAAVGWPGLTMLMVETVLVP